MQVAPLPTADGAPRASADKRLYGQFFTTTNPFVNEPFVRWFKAIPGLCELVLLEPFAGANNIVVMIQDLGFQNPWACYDIAPLNSDVDNATQYVVEQRDTLLHYPNGYEVAITNPPYLAKNSATARGLPYAGGKYDDLYKKALATMLTHTPYVAAIIPESFITQGLFHHRLACVVSLPCRMFEDTEVPVCLALFVPSNAKKAADDFEIWAESRRIGSFQALRAHMPPFRGAQQPWRFNEPEGIIGLHALDNQKEESIRFVLGADIPPERVSHTSRAITRIALEGLSLAKARDVVATAQKLLKVRRAATQDVFMTAFKGLRADGKYRRRLDFTQARGLLDEAYAVVVAAPRTVKSRTGKSTK